MINNLVNVSTAFFEGVLLVISPCVLSILPIVFSGSMKEGKWRPIGIILGLLFSFIFFSLFLGQLFLLFGIRPEILKFIAAILILVFGLFMVFPDLGNSFSGLTNLFMKIGNSWAQKANQFSQFNGLMGGLIIGISLGLIWTPCIGPLIASAFAQAVSQNNLGQNLAIILSFCLGIALPLLMFLMFSQNLILQVNFLKQNGKKLQQIFGCVIISSILLGSRPSFDFMQNWFKVKVLGDKTVQISAVTGLNRFQASCPVNI